MLKTSLLRSDSRTNIKIYSTVFVPFGRKKLCLKSSSKNLLGAKRTYFESWTLETRKNHEKILQGFS